MTEITPVNISAHLDPMYVTKDEIGMNLIDLGMLRIIMMKLLPPEQAQVVDKILQNMATSMQLLASLANATQAGMEEAIAQRDAAYEELAAITGTAPAMLRAQLDATEKELERLTVAVQQIDQENPDIAALVRTVWDAAQADVHQQIEAQRGV